MKRSHYIHSLIREALSIDTDALDQPHQAVPAIKGLYNQRSSGEQMQLYRTAFQAQAKNTVDAASVGKGDTVAKSTGWGATK
jgi:hypothetical protein